MLSTVTSIYCYDANDDYDNVDDDEISFIKMLSTKKYSSAYVAYLIVVGCRTLPTPPVDLKNQCAMNKYSSVPNLAAREYPDCPLTRYQY